MTTLIANLQHAALWLLFIFLKRRKKNYCKFIKHFTYIEFMLYVNTPFQRNVCGSFSVFCCRLFLCVFLDRSWKRQSACLHLPCSCCLFYYSGLALSSKCLKTQARSLIWITRRINFRQTVKLGLMLHWCTLMGLCWSWLMHWCTLMGLGWVWWCNNLYWWVCDV